MQHFAHYFPGAETPRTSSRPGSAKCHGHLSSQTPSSAPRPSTQPSIISFRLAAQAANPAASTDVGAKPPRKHAVEDRRIAKIMGIHAGKGERVRAALDDS